MAHSIISSVAVGLLFLLASAATVQTTAAFNTNAKCFVRSSIQSNAPHSHYHRHVSSGKSAKLYAVDPTSMFSSLELSFPTTTTILSTAEESAGSFVFNSDTWIFVVGIIPFVWASIEFWRRIAFGEPFGTGSDQIVIIGEDDSPTNSRGRRVLGKGALVVAYILFAISFATIGIVFYSIVSSTPPPEMMVTSI